MYIIRKAVNGFLVTEKHSDVERRIWTYNVRKFHRPRMSDAFLADSVDTTCLYTVVVQQLQC